MISYKSVPEPPAKTILFIVSQIVSVQLYFSYLKAPYVTRNPPYHRTLKDRNNVLPINLINSLILFNEDFHKPITSRKSTSMNIEGVFLVHDHTKTALILGHKKENITVIRIMMITHTNSFHNQGITTTHIMKMRKVIEIL